MSDTAGSGTGADGAAGAAAPAGTFLGTAAAPAAGAGGASVAPSNFFGEHVQKDGVFAEGWTTPLAEKFPRLANSAMRYKTEAEFLSGMDHALGLVGKKQQAVGYPKPGADEETVAAFRKESGVPDKPDQYQLKPEKLPDGVTWDDAGALKIAEVLHANHIPAEAGKALVAAHLESLVNSAGQAVQQQTARLQEMVGKTAGAMQKEWGQDYESRLGANQDFVVARFSPEDLADPAINLALSHPAIVRIVDEARRASRESPLPGAANTTATGTMTFRDQAVAIMTSNKNWRSDPALAARVHDLYAQQAAHNKRKS
jgi:hypothetical protein